MPTGASRTQLGEYNIRAVLHALRRLGPSSQQDLAAQAGLSVQAVSVILRGLLERGQVRELRTENSGRGRPRTIVDLVPEAAFSLGVHVDPSLVTAVALDLSGRPVRLEHSAAVDPSDPAASMEEAARLVRLLVGRLGPARERVVGAALAVPGRVDLGAGAIADSVWLPHWNGAPLGDLLAERLGVPVPLLKDTFAAVSGEIWVRGPELLGANTVFVYFGIGTGLGIAVEGKPLGGETGNAGQAGRLFEALAGSVEQSSPTAHDPVSLVRSAHETGLLPGPVPGPADLASVDARFRELSDRAQAGEGAALELLQGAGERVWQAALIAADVLDAGTVVFGGPYWPLLSGILLPRVEQRIARDPQRRGRQIRMLASALGADAGAIGAAGWVLEQRFSPNGALSTP